MQENGAIKRVFGNTMDIILPYDGCQKIGDYCFSPPKPNEAYSMLENEYGIWGNVLESIVIDKGYEEIGSYAFYNCRKLKEITLPNTLKRIGSEPFMNCHALERLILPMSICDKSILPSILAQISKPIEIVFEDAKLFFCEYENQYNEIAPAHIFSFDLQGVGYRLRQCFKEGRVNLEEYDSFFEEVKEQESLEVQYHFALNRFLYDPKRYFSYVENNASGIGKWLIDTKKQGALKELEWMHEQGVLNAETLSILIEKASQLQLVPLVTQLVSWKQKRKSDWNYEFEDFV